MTKIAFFQTHKYEKDFFVKVVEGSSLDISFFEPHLTKQTAPLSKGHEVACSFVNDSVDRETLQILSECGVRLLALRCAGFNHVDMAAADEFNISVVRVPSYSPDSVAEHAVCLLLSLSRKIHKSYIRTLSHNFSLDGLVGFNLHGKTVGVIGMGKIGECFARIMLGFGCNVLTYDLKDSAEFVSASLNDLLEQSDIVSLHVPLTPQTYHMLDKTNLNKMKKGAYIINTSRGALIDTMALSDALKREHIGGAGLDVYEEEESLFFQDLSEEIIKDETFTRLLSFPNVLVTSHQAFLTKEALSQIAKTTVENIELFFETGKMPNQILF